MKPTLPLLIAGLTLAGLVAAPQAFAQADDAKYAARDVANLKESQDIKTQPIADLAGFDKDFNHILFYGQSLSVGADSQRSLSVTQLPGNFMVGSPVAYQPEHKKELDPLIAIETKYDGEEPIFGTVNSMRRRLGDKPAPALIASSCGTSGKAIEQLMKDHGKNWPRLTGAVATARELAQAQGKTYGVSAICWVQGESNYSPSGDWTSLKDEYKTLLGQLRKDFITDCATNQKTPIFLTYQTGAAYSNDTNRLAIGMAQWELSKEVPGVVMATPVYPFTDFGGHLTSNGYRWMGSQFAKVLDKVLLKHEGWKPLSPLAVKREGRTLSIDFHVPEPPLVFDSPYIGRVKPALPDSKGFYVYDENGAVEIESIRIVGQTIVEIVAKRDFVGEAWVRFAGKTKLDGNGFLRDSDTAVADETYEYKDGTRQNPDENIADLVGKPYPLYNWCIAFDLKSEK